MSQSPKPRLRLNSRLLPILVGLLFIMQLTFPYKGWLIMLIGLGGAWLISYLWVWMLGRGLNLTREMRFGWAQVGDRLEERFTLTNTSLIPGLWVEIIDHSTLPDYQPGRVTGVGDLSETRWKTQGVCTQRGVFRLGPATLRTSDPFGFYTLILDNPASLTLTVTPPIVPLPGIEVAPGGRAGEGRSHPNAMERTVSVTGVRGYVPGDDLRYIHWPTSARRDSLFVRLFDNTPAGDWWVILDLDRRVQVGQGQASTEEHGVILAASMADRGLRSGRAVGLVANSRELAWLPPRGDDTQRWEILRQLALIEPGERSLGELLTRTRASFGRVVSLIIITSAVDGSWVEALLPLLRRGAIATVLLFDPPSYGGVADPRPAQAILSDFGVTHHLITRELLDRPEARPGQHGRWEWRISPYGRAVPIHRPREVTWQGLE